MAKDKPVQGVAVRGVRKAASMGEPLGPLSPDEVVVEEPLEIRAAGETVAVTLRTPGMDRELAVGFLLAEGVISSRDDIGSVIRCGRPDSEGYANSIELVPGAGQSLDIDRVSATRRGTLTTAACGFCGRRSVQDVLDRCRALPAGPVVGRASIPAALEILRSVQPNFRRTGGIHAAAILDERGRVLAAAEDIGRHNALDKAIGALVLQGKAPARWAPGGAALVVVSGRASFEVVQKAANAGIPIIVSVSAASSLAIDLADALGVTLCGFARGESATLYTHAERIADGELS